MIKRILSKQLFFISLCILQASCSGIRFPMRLALDQIDSTQGVILISMANRIVFFDNMQFDISHDEHTLNGGLRRSMSARDIKVNGVRRSFLVYVVPAGNYKLRGWRLSTGSSGYEIFGVGPATYCHLPFTVLPGKVNYLGDYEFEHSFKSHMFGSQVGIGGYFVVSDMFSEHLPLLERKFPNLDLNQVVSAMPDFAAYNTQSSGIYFKGINIP